ncbi:MAG: homocysteine S-methyltransferase family protein, partial [Acidiferrobacterales bacterium]
MNLLKDDVVLGDGGYVLELERRGYIQAGPYTPEVAIEHPDALEQLHLEFRRAGAQVLQALTFYASEDKLHTSGHAHEVEDINRAAVKVARKAAGDNAIVAGVIALTPTFESNDPDSHRRVREIFDQQVTLQKEEGVEFIIGETFLNLKEALIALEAVKAAGLVAMITMNFNGSGSPDGFTPEDCAKHLTD